MPLLSSKPFNAFFITFRMKSKIFSLQGPSEVVPACHLTVILSFFHLPTLGQLHSPCFSMDMSDILLLPDICTFHSQSQGFSTLKTVALLMPSNHSELYFRKALLIILHNIPLHSWAPYTAVFFFFITLLLTCHLSAICPPEQNAGFMKVGT